MDSVCPSCGWTQATGSVECEDCGWAGRRGPLAVVTEAKDAWTFAFGELGLLALVLTVALTLAMAAATA